MERRKKLAHKILINGSELPPANDDAISGVDVKSSTDDAIGTFDDIIGC